MKRLKFVLHDTLFGRKGVYFARLQISSWECTEVLANGVTRFTINWPSPCSSWHQWLQNVLSSRQWQPQPVGHTSCVQNHSIMWLVWPPWPQVKQKLEEPLTATWHMAHWKVKPLQMAHWVPRTSLRQWLQYTPNSIPLWGSGGVDTNLRTSARFSRSPHRYRISP